ncbi:ATP-binding protein [Chitinilyticum aquatile]|uniref:ATP-binding protein n=1 Tax=Chitinilyticum aquatile TaxID=362520 RepID=UPI000411A4A7|nr:ATP-binding protein [Chitinilyticum aquatile]
MRNWSIARRLLAGALIVQLVFFCLAGFALQDRYAEHLRASRLERLKSEIYLLMAATELDAAGRLQLPATLAEPLFALPDSGLYASIYNPAGSEQWHAASSSGRQLPVLPRLATGEWQFTRTTVAGVPYQSAAYQVRWAIGGKAQTLLFAVHEDERPFLVQLGHFRGLLWWWLGGAGVVLLLAQGLLLRWGLAPLRRVEGELALIESGAQNGIQGDYPPELAMLTGRLNSLVEQERVRQQRYRDALGDLAHSLKTPLAVLQQSRDDPDYAARVQEQLERMNRIIAHQLSRAAARGSQALGVMLPLRPVLERLLAALGKVHGHHGVVFTLACDPELAWPLDEGDLYELCGNVLDNAGKWAQQRVQLSVSVAAEALILRVDDDGPGFTDAAAALQRGVRLDESVPGQGIGLTVVADIVAAYGGSLQLARGELGGAQVLITIPARLA